LPALGLASSSAAWPHGATATHTWIVSPVQSCGTHQPAYEPRAPLTDAEAATVVQEPRSDVPLVPVRVEELVYEPRKVVDPRTKLEVCQVLVPSGWQLEPGILWREMAAVFVSMQTAIFDPKSGWAVRWIPQDQFNCNLTLFHNARQQGVAPVNAAGVEFTDFLPDATQYIRSIVLPRYRNIPALEVVSVKELPAVAEALMRRNEFMIATYSQFGREMRYSAGHVVVEYPGPGGTKLTEDIHCVLNVSWSPQANALAQQVGLPPDYFFMPDRLYSYTAPKGQLAAAEPYLQTIVQSMRVTARWYSFVENIQGQVRLILADRNAMEAAARKAITESQRKTVEETWKAADQQSREVGALLTGTQARTNPNDPKGPPIAGPAGMNTWVNKQGRIKHLPPGEDPNRDPGSSKDWTMAKSTRN
jgi:hypothetical protein